MFTSRHSADGRSSFTYPSSYDLAWWFAKVFAVACAPGLLWEMSIHRSLQDNLLHLALAAPGLILGLIWGRRVLRFLIDLGIVLFFESCRILRWIATLWRNLRQPGSQPTNVLKFPRAGR